MSQSNTKINDNVFENTATNDEPNKSSRPKYRKVQSKYNSSKEIINQEKIDEVKKYLSESWSISSIIKRTGISRYYVQKIVKGEDIIVAKRYQSVSDN